MFHCQLMCRSRVNAHASSRQSRPQIGVIFLAIIWWALPMQNDFSLPAARFYWSCCCVHPTSCHPRPARCCPLYCQLLKNVVSCVCVCVLWTAPWRLDSIHVTLYHKLQCLVGGEAITPVTISVWTKQYCHSYNTCIGVSCRLICGSPIHHYKYHGFCVIC